MQNFSDVARSWSDTLTTLSVGFLLLFVPLVTRVRVDESQSISLSVSFGDIPKYFQFAEQPGTIGALILSLMLLCIIYAMGSVLIQSGDFQVILFDRKHGAKASRRRIEYVSQNSASMLMFSNAYSSYRLLCGLGAVLQCYAALLLSKSVSNFSLAHALLALILLSGSVFVIFFLARHSFSGIDWMLQDELGSDLPPIPIPSDPLEGTPACTKVPDGPSEFTVPLHNGAEVSNDRRSQPPTEPSS
jgi:hypothetical protein